MSGYEVVRLTTSRRSVMVDITDQVRAAVRRMGRDAGTVLVYCPHTTAAVTINEGADPSVKHDIIDFLERAIPQDGPFTHAEGNSDAHIKAALVGPSKLVMVDGGDLVLGTWQRIFFCEFDGPRSRHVWVKATC